MTLGVLYTTHENISLTHANVKDKSPDVVKSYEFGSRIVGVNLINKIGRSVTFLRRGERISITFDLVTQVSEEKNKFFLFLHHKIKFYDD